MIRRSAPKPREVSSRKWKTWMSATASSSSPRGILICNDDGPPSVKHSPFQHLFITKLLEHYGFTPDGPCQECPKVLVCIPSQQQSFVGHAITRSNLTARFVTVDGFLADYPEEECNANLRSICKNAGDLVRFCLVAGSPAAACNIGLEHIAPFDIDLVISGPNVGQNAGSSFINSSGTVGAALEGSIQGVKSIALSYFYSSLAFKKDQVETASVIAMRIIDQLWRTWSPTVELYNVNIPLGADLDVTVYTTTIHHERSYGELFTRIETRLSDPALHGGQVMEEDLTFTAGRLRFDPDAPVGTDRWALNHRFASVTPLVGIFQIAPLDVSPFAQASSSSSSAISSTASVPTSKEEKL
eukprot:TRINITY_DN6144_c0_g1_i2.p1 TRINITY_DN6144_c0_g1~~TRINITY_DN6144_c0_g1_i2.p1  ORF type:complete len:357 (+),score=81.39 TRINITY_DN6144_c0_g1_i2:924-1994(+)